MKTKVKVFKVGDMTALMHVTTDTDKITKEAVKFGYVNWFNFNSDRGLKEIERWFNDNPELDKVYAKVLKYAETNDVTLWSY